MCCMRARYGLRGRIDGPVGTQQLQETAPDGRMDGRTDEENQDDKSEREERKGRGGG